MVRKRLYFNHQKASGTSIDDLVPEAIVKLFTL